MNFKDLPPCGSVLVDGYMAMADYIIENSNSNPVIIAGIRDKGSLVARRVAHHLKQKGVEVIDDFLEPVLANNGELNKVALGYVNGSDSRGGITGSGYNYDNKENTVLPINIDGRADVFLIDDVIYTGRTARTALGEFADHTRYATVRLLTLLDRAKRELPVQPDYVFITANNGPANKRFVLKQGDDEAGNLDKIMLN